MIKLDSNVIFTGDLMKFYGDFWLYDYLWLVVEPTHLKNMSSSIGMIIPNIGEN